MAKIKYNKITNETRKLIINNYLEAKSSTMIATTFNLPKSTEYCIHQNTVSKIIFKILLHIKESLLFLPPYTPQFNPIENMFSKWKDWIRRNEPQNVDELNTLINTGLDHISPSDCK
ncbi:MAG: hypothetical protein GY928_21630, partial [Colwellia sp.]|nr:hypothetical protein [Colwellia sp.]